MFEFLCIIKQNGCLCLSVSVICCCVIEGTVTEPVEPLHGSLGSSNGATVKACYNWSLLAFPPKLLF